MWLPPPNKNITERLRHTDWPLQVGSHRKIINCPSTAIFPPLCDVVGASRGGPRPGRKSSAPNSLSLSLPPYKCLSPTSQHPHSNGENRSFRLHVTSKSSNYRFFLTSTTRWVHPRGLNKYSLNCSEHTPDPTRWSKTSRNVGASAALIEWWMRICPPFSSEKGL